MDSTTIVWVVVVLLAPALAVSTVPSATVAIPHDDAESLTGGIVYRGDLVPALRRCSATSSSPRSGSAGRVRRRSSSGSNSGRTSSPAPRRSG
jgi:hypothetical protein